MVAWTSIWNDARVPRWRQQYWHWTGPSQLDQGSNCWCTSLTKVHVMAWSFDDSFVCLSFLLCCSFIANSRNDDFCLISLPTRGTAWMWTSLITLSVTPTILVYEAHTMPSACSCSVASLTTRSAIITKRSTTFMRCSIHDIVFSNAFIPTVLVSIPLVSYMSTIHLANLDIE